MPLPTWFRLLSLDTARHRLGRALYLRALGLIYLIAVLSWWCQASLLVGEDGLVPASRWLEEVERQLTGSGQAAPLVWPTLFWYTGASDAALHTLCVLGCVLALLVVVGRVVGPALTGLWVIYLSLMNTGGVFMSFQWDILLLEAGFLAILLAPWCVRLSWRRPPALRLPNRVALVLTWFLLAKLMFFSGWVKLAWASESRPEWWPEGTALCFHYMTQPLPTWTAWWMHQLPEGFHKASLLPMYLVELVLPFALVLGRWGRLVAALGFAGLMGLILLTGNFTYFNWLTIALCLSLVHDRCWPRRLWRRLGLADEEALIPPASRKDWIALAVTSPVLLLVILLNGHSVCSDLHQAPKPMLSQNWTPAWIQRLAERCASYRLVSGYGLFRTMTTTRPEIILEGSRDGLTWHAYDFKWKVDEIDERPRFVAPHQPRVAWQFWFAALEGQYHPRSPNAAWFESLVLKLLRGDESVKGLLRHDPFPEAPPHRLRARLMLYEFTSREERRRRGEWWKRRVLGFYLPEVRLESVAPQ